MKGQIIRCGILMLLFGLLSEPPLYASKVGIVSQSDKTIELQGTVLDDEGVIVGASV